MDNYKDIRDTLNHAKLCHEAWWIFTGRHPEREQIEAVYNNYLDFFRTIDPALYCTFVIKLSSLFGSRTDEISLKKLPNIEKYSEFKNLWERGRRLHKYRSKVIAHRDKDVSIRNFAKETGFTYDDLKKILDDTCLLFDTIAKNNKVQGTYNFSCESALLRLISDLYEYKNI